MLLQQIDKLVTETEHRRENADYLTAGLQGDSRHPARACSGKQPAGLASVSVPLRR